MAKPLAIAELDERPRDDNEEEGDDAGNAHLKSKHTVSKEKTPSTSVIQHDSLRRK